MKQRYNKYNARETVVDGNIFHSAAEANRYKVLKLLEKSGHIKDLKLQVPMPFIHNGDTMFVYYANFSYYDSEGRFIIEAVKSKATSMAVYRLQKKLIESYYGVVITEI